MRKQTVAANRNSSRSANQWYSRCSAKQQQQLGVAEPQQKLKAAAVQQQQRNHNPNSLSSNQYYWQIRKPTQLKPSIDSKRRNNTSNSRSLPPQNRTETTQQHKSDPPMQNSAGYFTPNIPNQNIPSYQWKIVFTTCLTQNLINQIRVQLISERWGVSIN